MIIVLLVALVLFIMAGTAIVKSYLVERRKGMSFDEWMFAPVLPTWVTWANIGGWTLLATAWLI